MKHNPFLIFGAISFALFIIGVIISSAIDAGVLGWLIFGVIVLCGIGAAITAFAVRQRVKWKEVDIKLLEIQNKHEEVMAEKGYTLPVNGWIRVNAQIEAPKEKPAPQVDPRHDLLIALCMATILSDGYGPLSERLLTADDAQARGGRFADRNNWDAASKYGQDIGLLYTKVGGPPKEQGLKVNGVGSGGRTVTDLLEALHTRNVITDSAVAALPVLVR